MGELISDNFPLILSTLVSVLLASANFYQAWNQKKIKLMELNFGVKQQAYTKLLKAIMTLERLSEGGGTQEIRFLSVAANAAMLVSTQKTAEKIDSFCLLYIDKKYRGVSDVSDEDYIKRVKELQQTLRAELPKR